MLDALQQAVAIAKAKSRGVPVIGIAGAQGSGKTTLLRSFAAQSGERIAGFSLDDVYLGLAERRALGDTLHPLFRTRGVPGTHDIPLLHQTLDALQGAHDGSVTSLPVFDKALDDRAPLMAWPNFVGRPSLIIVDGWCMGATPQRPEELAQQINALEERDDPDGVWRSEVNGFLRSPYQEAFARLDAILFLKAPSFDVVLDWRCEQEAGLLKRELREADRARIAHFIAHYERITRHMLAGGARADVTAELDAKRQVTAIRTG